MIPTILIFIIKLVGDRTQIHGFSLTCSTSMQEQSRWHICNLFDKHGKTCCVRERKRGEVDEVRDDDQRIKLTAKIFPHQISHTQSTKSKICDGHATYFQKVRGLTVANLGLDKVLSDIWCGNIGGLAWRNESS